MPHKFFAPWYLHLVLTTILKRYTVAGRLYVEAANPRKLLLQLWNDQKPQDQTCNTEVPSSSLAMTAQTTRSR